MQILCYRLIDPSLLVENALLIRRIFFPDDTIFDDPDVRFDISPYSGFITFFNYKLMWQSGGELGPLNEVEKAQQFATDFLDSITKLTGTEQQLKKARIPSLFPPRSKYDHLETVSVMHPENGTPDHWLSRFGISLRVEFSKTLAGNMAPPAGASRIAMGMTEEDDAEEKPPPELKTPSAFYAPVLFAAAEVRANFKGQIIGLNIRWRPFDNFIRTDFTFFEQDDSETSSAGKKATSSDDPFNKDNIVFVLDTVEAPAFFLSPYYFVSEEEHVDEASLHPASNYSLAVDIFQENLDEGANLLPMVTGGSGNYDYHWGKWQIDKVAEEGIRYLGQSNQISVDLGVYNIILDVEDRKTHQVKRFQKMIYANGILEESKTSPPG